MQIKTKTSNFPIKKTNIQLSKLQTMLTNE